MALAVLRKNQQGAQNNMPEQLQTNADFYKYLYNTGSTDILTLYVTQLQYTARNRQSAQREVGALLGRLDAIIARQRQKEVDARNKNERQEQKLKHLRALSQQRRLLLKELNSSALAAARIEEAGIGRAISVGEARQKVIEDVDKMYTLPASARKEIASIISKAELDLTSEGRLDQILQMATTAKGLSPSQQMAYSMELDRGLQDVRSRQPASTLSTTDIKGYVADIMPLVSSVSTQAEIDQDKRGLIKQGHKPYLGMDRMTTIQEETWTPEKKKKKITAKKLISKQIAKLSSQIVEAEAKVDPANKRGKARLLQEDPDLKGYLQDASDWTVTGSYLDEQGERVEYDDRKAEQARQELLQISSEFPHLVDLDTRLLLDRTGYVRNEQRRKELLSEREQLKGGASELAALLQAPQFTGVTPLGEIRKFVNESTTGLHQQKLMAELIAREGLDEEYSQLYFAAAPNQRIIFAIQPDIQARLAQVTFDEKTTEMGKAFVPKNKAEREAQKYIDALPEGALASIQAPAIVRFADEMFKGNDPKKAEFLTYILSAQRIENDPDWRGTGWDAIVKDFPKEVAKRERQRRRAEWEARIIDEDDAITGEEFMTPQQIEEAKRPDYLLTPAEILKRRDDEASLETLGTERAVQKEDWEVELVDWPEQQKEDWEVELVDWPEQQYSSPAQMETEEALKRAERAQREIGDFDADVFVPDELEEIAAEREEKKDKRYDIKMEEGADVFVPDVLFKDKDKDKDEEAPKKKRKKSKRFYQMTQGRRYRKGEREEGRRPLIESFKSAFGLDEDEEVEEIEEVEVEEVPPPSTPQEEAEVTLPTRAELYPVGFYIKTGGKGKGYGYTISKLDASGKPIGFKWKGAGKELTAQSKGNSLAAFKEATKAYWLAYPKVEGEE
jgi:hypothetical protein